MSYTKENILEVLKSVQDPDLNESLVQLGMIDNIYIQGSKLTFDILLTTAACPLKELMKDECTLVIHKKLPDITEVEISFGQKLLAPKEHHKNLNASLLRRVKNILVVISGKGGVGKSTIAVNLAIAIQKLGGKVGILDTDIYGPNIPNMLSAEFELPKIRQENKLEIISPVEIRGIKVVSMQFFIPKGEPILWRGPMLHSIIKQFLEQTDWGELDYLVIDTPPGTGDVQLTLGDLVNIDGAIVVSTAQDASILDVKRSIQQLQKLNMPILGAIENMSYFVPEDMPNKRYDLFGSHDGETLQQALDIPIIGTLPFLMVSKENHQQNQPALLNQKNVLWLEEMMSIARKIVQEVAIQKYPFSDEF